MSTVKVFKSGNSQAIRIPKEFSVNEEELHIQKAGSSILLTSVSDIWKTFQEGLDSFTDDFLSEGRNQPEQQSREEI